LFMMCLYFLANDPKFRIRTGPWWIFWPLGALNLILLWMFILKPSLKFPPLL
jgi:hypothetical protein